MNKTFDDYQKVIEDISKANETEGGYHKIKAILTEFEKPKRYIKHM